MRRFPWIEEKKVTKLAVIKDLMSERLMAYLEFLSAVQPDLKHQLSMLIKFERHMFKVFRTVHKTPGLGNLRTVIHGDSKVGD